MRLQLPLESDAQLAKACEPAMRALYNPSMFAQTLAALYSFSCNATGDPSSLQIVTATLVVISFVCMQLGWSAPWPAFESFDRWQRIQALLKPHIESCLFAALTSTTRGMPRASTTIWRLQPSLPRSVGLAPVSWPPRGLELTSHQCWPEPNRSDRLDEDIPALPCAGAARLLQLATVADVSNTSCRCRGQAIAAGPAKEYLSAEHKEFLGMHPHR